MRTRILFLLLTCLPVFLLAFGSSPLVRRAGVPTDDNGATCTACHQVSTPPRGLVSLNVSSYTPTQTQLIHVTIADPQAVRWGFQLTARQVSDSTRQAGTFDPVDPTVVTVRCDDGTPAGSPAPCNGLREFAQQVNAPVTAQGAGFTFDVNWTPPAQEVGTIAFYVAAVAANNDGQATGDHTYTAVSVVPAVGACNNTKAPTLQRVVEAGSFSNNLASGGLWTIFGLDFESSNLKRSVGLGDFVNGAFPTVLGCISVLVNNQPVPITYVQTDQINLQGPAVSGPVNVTVVSNPGLPQQRLSAVGMANVLPVAPVFLTFNGTSIAARDAFTGAIIANPAVLPGAKPAKPGDIVSLYATGFGATNPAVAPGAIATGVSRISAAFTVRIGGVTLAPADVPYVGLSPGSISGLYQLNVRIPPSTPDGDIPVVVTAGGLQTQTGATIPVKAPQL